MPHAAGYGTCLLELGTYLKIDCFNYPKSGISAIAFALPGHGITDFSDETQWNAAITTNHLRVVGGCESGVKVEVPASSEVTTDNPSGCSGIPLVDGFDNQLNWEDANVNSTNETFYSNLVTASGATVILYMCEEDNIRVIADELVIYVSSMPVVDFSNKVRQKYMGTVRWFTASGDVASTISNTPDGIFC